MSVKALPLILLICAVSTAARASLRVALINTNSAKATADLVSLAEVKLSQDDRVELLERGTIRRVLEEQKLSLSGLVDADQAVAAGKLLRVEIFAFIQALGKDDPPVLSVFDAFNGAQLVDVELPKQDVEAQVDAIAIGVDRARSKLAAPANARTLCLLAVRNADLPRQMDGVCNGVAMLLERRLLASDDVRLLERKRLDGINRERQLGALDPKHDILASLVTLELEFARTPDGAGTSVTAILSDAAGKLIAKPSLPLDKNDVVKAVNQLAARIADELKVVPGQIELDPAKEGPRFLREGQFLLAHGQLPEALRAAESAYALSPDYRNSGTILAFALLRRADQMVRNGENVPRALEMATRAMEIRENRIATLRGKSPRDRDLTMHPDNSTSNYVMSLLTHAQSAPASEDLAVRAAARQFGDAYVRFAHDWLISSETAAAGDAAALGRHLEYIRLNDVIPCLALASETRGIYVEEICGLYERYLNLLAKDYRRASLRLYINVGRGLDEADCWRVPMRQWTPADFDSQDRERIAHLHQVLADNDAAAVRFYGLRARLIFEQAAGQLSAHDCETLVSDARKAARAAMDDEALIAIDRNGFLRNHLYWDAMTMIPRDAKSDRRLADRLDWYDFILARGEIPQLAIQFLPQLARMDAPADDVVRILKGLNELLDSRRCRLVGFSAAEARTIFAERTRDLANDYPQVRAAFQQGTYEVRSLLAAGAGNVTEVGHVIADEHAAYAIVTASAPAPGQGGVTQAMSVPLDGGAARTLGAVPGAVEAHDACLSDRWLVAATDHGVYLFPRDRGGGAGAPTKITAAADGLPTDIVQSVAMIGDVVYAGLGDRGYLVSFDITTRKCTVLASSRRKQKASPFDDVSGFTIPRIVFDAPRNRLLLVHCHPGRHAENGLWQLDPATNEFKQLLKVYFDYGDANAGATRILPDGRMLIHSYNWAASFNTADDSRQMLFGDSIGMGSEHRVKSMPFEFNQHVAPPFTMVGDDLWAARPLCRIEPRTNRVDSIELPSRGRGEECQWIEPLAGGGRVIVGNARGIWLVSPAKRAAATTRATASTKPASTQSAR